MVLHNDEYWKGLAFGMNRILDANALFRLQRYEEIWEYANFYLKKRPLIAQIRLI